MTPIWKAHASIMRRAAKLERKVRDATVYHDVSMPASGLYILMLLDERGPLALSDITRAVDWIANPAYVVGLMEKMALLERETRAADRRFGDCTITDAGREKMRQIVATLDLPLRAAAPATGGA